MNSKISQKTIELAKIVFVDVKKRYISAEAKFLEPLWVEKYNVIKADSWPDCHRYEDFDNLDIIFQQECITLHNFSPDIWMQSIIDEAEFVCDITKNSDHTNYHLLRHIELIEGKKVIDFASHTGGNSFFCYNHGSSYVQGVEIREECVEIARSIQQESSIPDSKMNFLVGDIHNYELVKQLCLDKDTVLLCGIMYHIHDHVDILTAICQPSVKHVVIETAEASAIMKSAEPMIWWKYEHTSNILAGHYENKDIIPIGYPNLSWFNLIMKKLGFEIVNSTERSQITHHSESEEFREYRSVHVYKRIDNKNAR